MLDTPELYNGLEDAMIARDFPGMADVDSSYLLFFKEVKKQAKVTLSGECSDEIFRSVIHGILEKIVWKAILFHGRLRFRKGKNC